MKLYLKESIKHFLRSPLLARRYINEVEDLYTLSLDELHNRDEKRFLSIFRNAIGSSSFYKTLYGKYGIGVEDIRRLEDITKLPIIEKNDIKANPSALLTVSRTGLVKNHTSGSTGTPLTVYEDYSSILRERAYLHVFWKRRGYTPGKRIVSLRGNLGSSLFGLKVHTSNTLFLSSYRISPESAERYFKEIVKFKPVAIEGYPSSLYNLCYLFKEKGLSLSVPVCFTSSETLFDFQRKLIEEVLNTRLYDYYGNTERTVALAECLDHRGYFSPPGYSINEITDDSIVTTSLINSSFPLIRYRVDDVVTRTTNPSLINGELCIVDSIEGRSDDVIIARDDSRIGRVDLLFKNTRHIKLAQIIQQEKGEMIVNIVPDGIFSEEDKQALTKKIDERIGIKNMAVIINTVTDLEIIYTNRNKFRQVISQIRQI